MTYRLFKYRSFAGDVARRRTRRVVAERQIYYAAPNQFNDPFDCDVCLCMDGADLGALGLPNCGDGNAKVKAYSENWLRNEATKEYAVLSLSAVADSLLMWSHYADCHRGICLELQFEATEPLHEVRYSTERPVLYYADFGDATCDRFARTVMDTLTTKSPDWAYEKEWRCIDTGGHGERPMPADMLTGIIFGCRTPDSDKAMVRDWAASTGNRIFFYQAKQKDAAFALEIERLDA